MQKHLQNVTNYCHELVEYELTGFAVSLVFAIVSVILCATKGSVNEHSALNQKVLWTIHILLLLILLALLYVQAIDQMNTMWYTTLVYSAMFMYGALVGEGDSESAAELVLITVSLWVFLYTVIINFFDSRRQQVLQAEEQSNEILNTNSTV